MTSSDQGQRSWLPILLASGCTLFALPVVLPVLLAISPVLVVAGLAWTAWRVLEARTSERAVAPAAPHFSPQQVREQAEKVRAAESASTSGSSQPSAHSKENASRSTATDKAEGVSVKAAASNSSHATANGGSKAEDAARKPAGQSERPAKASSSDSKSPLANSTNKVQAAAKQAAGKTQQPAVPATGSAALLARIRNQRKASTKAAPSANGAAPTSQQAKEVIVAYASQTGTAQEIARNIQAESFKHGIQSKVLSFNELGMDSVLKPKKQVVVMVVSSTGEGDPPDNSVRFYGHSKRRSLAQDALQHVEFSCLGLGDSNYTRYMGVPRAFKGRFAELGARVFYPHMEADEVDGLEEFVDKWVAGLWGPLKAAALGASQSEASAGAATDEAATHGNAALSQAAGTASQPPDLPTANGQAPSANGLTPEAQRAIPKGQTLPTEPGSAPLKGVPALPQCRVKIVVEEDEKVASQIRQAESRHPSQAEAEYRDPEGMYSPEQPFWGIVSDAYALTSPESDRQVLHVEFHINNSGIQYQPGDSIGLLPHNSPQLVQGILQHLDQDGSQVISIASSTGDDAKLLQHLRWPCSLERALTAGCDLTSVPRKSLLRVLGEHCSAAGDKQRLLHLCSAGGRQDYATDIKTAQPSLLDLLHQFPSCQPPLAALLDSLPPLAPRMYSLSCSPLASPNAVQVAFSVVNFQTSAGVKHGVATNWLRDLCRPVISGSVTASQANIRLPLYLRRGGSFGPPVQSETGKPDLSAPMLMIGPGTGVAPFRGFLQQRQHDLKAGSGADAAPAWLYFGCRQQHEDFLYQEDLLRFETDGVLDKLRVAFSRAQSSKVYVQDLLQQDAQEVCQLLQHPGAHVYVCGDGASMAKDVHNTLLDILESQSSFSKNQATLFLADMTKQQRYVRDIWS